MKSITDKINEELKKIPEPSILPEVIQEPIDTILLSDDKYSMSLDNMNSSYKLDDYIIQPLDLANLSPLLSTVTLSGSSSSIYQSSTYNTTNPPGYNWNTVPSNNNVNIHSTGIDLTADADIMIGGRSMKKLLEGIEQRLSILVPDPKKLARYEALQQAYEHYKTLEALCNEEPKQDTK